MEQHARLPLPDSVLLHVVNAQPAAQRSLPYPPEARAVARHGATTPRRLEGGMEAGEERLKVTRSGGEGAEGTRAEPLTAFAQRTKG